MSEHPSDAVSDIPLQVINRARLWPFHANLDGRRHKIAMGAWAVYLPGAQMKLLHAVAGNVHCIYHKAPRREAVLAGRPVKVNPRTTPEQWRAAFRTPVTRRVAENYVVFQRLFQAGIGPEPLGLVVVANYRSWFSRGPGISAGFRVANLYEYPPKTATTEEQLRAAGVIPDGSLATIREQINGYVSDLNSVQGAMPLDAEPQVAAIQQRLDQALAQASKAPQTR